MIFTCAPKKACIYNLHCITTVSLSHKPWQQRWLASNTQQGQHLLHRAATEASTSSLVTRWEWSAAGCTIEKKELFKLASGPRIPSAHSWAFEDSVMLQLLGGQSPEQPVPISRPSLLWAGGWTVTPWGPLQTALFDDCSLQAHILCFWSLLFLFTDAKEVEDCYQVLYQICFAVNQPSQASTSFLVAASLLHGWLW